MADDLDQLFETYNRMFDKNIGRLSVGQFGRWERNLVERLDRAGFEDAWRHFRELEQQVRAVSESGGTVTNALYDELQERAAKLLLKEGSGSYWW